MPIEKIYEFKKPSREDAIDLLRRSTVAWLQGGGREMPSKRSGFKLHKELGYVVLHGAGGVLAVYRVRPDNGALRRMARWPAAIEK